MICSKIQQQLNEAILKGHSSITIEDEDITHKQIDELLECGFNVKCIKRENETQYFVIFK